MDLTEQQRLSLWSHFRILAAAENDPTWWEFAEILRRGLVGEYYRLTESFSEELSERECGEVRDVLHLYHELQSSNRQLEQTRAVDQDRLRFPGFDPDDETGLVTYVSFIRKNLGEYRDLEVDGRVGEAEPPGSPTTAPCWRPSETAGVTSPPPTFGRFSRPRPARRTDRATTSMVGPSPPASLLLYERSAMRSDLMAGTLSELEYVELIGTAASLEEATEGLERRRPDLLVASRHVPEEGAIRLARRLRGSDYDTALLVVGLADLAHLCQQKGLKVGRLDRLTSREREVLTWLGERLSNREIAARLHIEVSTVKFHVHNILEKLEVANRREAARYLLLADEAEES